LNRRELETMLLFSPGRTRGAWFNMEFKDVDFEDFANKLNNKFETTKSLALVVGKDVSTIQRWMNRAGYYTNDAKEWFYTESADQRKIKKPTNKPKSQPTNKQPKKEPTLQPTKEQMNVLSVQTKEVIGTIRKRTSFDLDTQLVKQLKIKAVMDDRNVYEIVEQAIREYLNKAN
jgi:hypothetical protein